MSSLLPQSRSVDVDTPATVFATLINPTAELARNCRVAASSIVPAAMSYQAADAGNELIGAPNTPVDIAPGAAQAFVLSFAPAREFRQSQVRLRFECDNADPAALSDGVNILRLSASSNAATPDIIAMAATALDDGVVHLPDSNRAGVFAVATSNVGEGSQLNITVDSGDANPPVAYTICETDPQTGACLDA